MTDQKIWVWIEVKTFFRKHFRFGEKFVIEQEFVFFEWWLRCLKNCLIVIQSNFNRFHFYSMFSIFLCRPISWLVSYHCWDKWKVIIMRNTYLHFHTVSISWWVVYWTYSEISCSHIVLVYWLDVYLCFFCKLKLNLFTILHGSSNSALFLSLFFIFFRSFLEASTFLAKSRWIIFLIFCIKHIPYFHVHLIFLTGISAWNLHFISRFDKQWRVSKGLGHDDFLAKHVSSLESRIFHDLQFLVLISGRSWTRSSSSRRL